MAQTDNSEEELVRFFDLVPDMACIASADGSLKRINKAWEDVLGFSKEELLAMPFLDLIHPDDRDKTMEEVKKQIDGGWTKGFINRYRCKDGSWRWLEWMATPAVDKAFLYAVARDITGRKQMEDSLRRTEEGLEAVTVAAQDAILMMDPQENICFWNPAAQRILGYRSEEVIGRNLHQLLAPEHFRKAFEATYPEFRRTGNGAAIGKTLELMAIRKDGAEIVIELSLSSVLREDGWHAVGILRDITARKQVEETNRRQLHELQVFYQGAIGREERILELKNEVAKLKKELGRS